jgi:hypothetical protein
MPAEGSGEERCDAGLVVRPVQDALAKRRAYQLRQLLDVARSGGADGLLDRTLGLRRALGDDSMAMLIQDSRGRIASVVFGFPRARLTTKTGAVTLGLRHCRTCATPSIP